jgi:hypothetical protein
MALALMLGTDNIYFKSVNISKRRARCSVKIMTGYGLNGQGSIPGRA